MTSNIAAVLVAAGRGERAGGSRGTEGPKQYRRIGDKPVIRHTVEKFLASGKVDRVLVAVHADDLARLDDALGELRQRVETVIGGATRQASVLAALRHLAVAPPEAVLIHDAVRPFVDVAFIDEMADAAIAWGAALPVVAVSDTLKAVSPDGFVERTVPRAGLYGAQTPQAFQFELIRTAHERAALETAAAFTDDASIAEWAGIPVAIVAASPKNIKLTTAADIELADQRLGRALMIDVRVGNGYDVHQLVAGDHVTLCGVRIPHDQALLGHSDADVGLHALTDALLATCGEGDIGTHFPPSDPQWRGAASGIFVEHAARLVAAKGGRVCNVDITLIAEAPKVGPHRAAMQDGIAAMLGIAAARVSIKATTNETIGFIGRREGIAAIATASVVYDGA